MERATCIATVVFLTFLITSCGEDRGPAEQVGEKVDKAVENAAERVENEGPAEQAGEKIDKAVQQAADRVQEAGETVGEAIENAGEQLKEKSGG